MQQLSWLVVYCLPALFGVIACPLAIFILVLAARKNRNPAAARELPLLLRHGTRVAVGMLVLLLVAAGVLGLLDKKRSQELLELQAGVATDGLPKFGPQWALARMPDGEPAPDFTLPDLRTGAKVTFSQYRGSRPAVLVFGSPGCNLFCDSAGMVRRLHEQYKEKVAFVFIHVTNAPHSLPKQVTLAYEKVESETPTAEQRQAKARAGVDFFEFPFPCLLDTEDKRVETLYDAWPRRLIVVQANGRIARDIGRGIANFWSYQAVRDCLAQQLPKGAAKEAAHHASASTAGIDKTLTSPLLPSRSVPPAAPAVAGGREALPAGRSSPAPLG